MKSRQWSIRAKIIALVSVPLTAFLAIWIFATVLTAGPALNLLSARSMVDNIGNPGRILVGELQRERRLSVQFLSTAGPVPSDLDVQRAATDRAAEDFRRSAGSGDAWDRAGDALRARISQLFTELNSLAGQRVHINQRETDAIGAQGIYNKMSDAAFEMFTSTATYGDEDVDADIRGLTTYGRGQEYLARVDSLLAGATVAGRFTESARAEINQDIGIARFLIAGGVGELPEASRTEFEVLSRSAEYTELNRMMDTVAGQSRTGGPSPVPGDRWHDAYVASAQQLRGFELDAIDALADRTTPVAVGILVRLGLAAALGLIALILSILVSIRVGRSIVGRLRRLRGEALEMAAERLPTVVRRLQRGEEVDVDVETPPLEYGRDEIGQLGQAFNDVQRTAVQSAVEEANVRRGLNEVFLNIARRSQTLLHRQLALLDRMERRETEPQELEDLYRVDHLATRMRRHAEDLVILAGAAPGRGWRNPVPVIDVVRGAISEVEDYKRVDIRSVESASVHGRAVGDIIHLLAELLENAASFSPPHTRVQVVGQVLPRGYAVEIEDRGLGMTKDAIDEANRRLVEPPDFDPADSARLGLFVVAQLANRHGIRVSLRESAYGGVTAIVLVPGDLISSGPAALPSAGSTPDTPQTRERPLVGSGNQDRRSLAALQWQGSSGEIEQITTARPATVNGVASPIPRQRRDEPPARPEHHQAETESESEPGSVRLTGPSPSSVADGLSADGLVQRRRLRRPVDLATSDDVATETARRAVPRNSGPAMPTSSSPLFPGSPPIALPAAPTSAAPLFAAPTSPAAPSVGAVPAEAEETEDGLPRRVRQANLVPQLRRKAGAEPDPDEATVAFRSPEQVRSIMSALQQGTTRGRIDASRYAADDDQVAGPAAATTGEDSGDRGRGSGASFAEAATVSFPAIVNLATARDDTSPGDGDAAGDRAGDLGGNDVTRPEKDAQ